MGCAGAVIVWAALLIVGCGGDATPDGTEIVSHRYGPAVAGSQATLGSAAGPARTTERAFVIDPGEGETLDSDWPEVRLRFSVVHGPVQVVSERPGYPETWDVPQEIRVVAEEAGELEIRSSCDARVERGIYMPQSASEHEGLWRDCRFDLRRGGGNTIVHSAVFGDGEIRVEPPRGGSVRPAP